MSVHIGVDIQLVSEIENSMTLVGARYLDRVYDSNERGFARAHPNTAAMYLAGRFAAREAVLKLLEAPDVISIWKDVSLSDALNSNSPEVTLCGEASNLAVALGISKIFVCLSMGADSVSAVAVADSLASKCG